MKRVLIVRSRGTKEGVTNLFGGGRKVSEICDCSPANKERLAVSKGVEE